LGRAINYYSKHIGDFNNKTRHLSRLERSIFSDAIELYYDTEKPLISDINKLSRLLLATTDEEKASVNIILEEFFTLKKDGYHNKRCDKEILKYHQFIEKQSKAGKASAERRLNIGTTKSNQRSTSHTHIPIPSLPIPSTQIKEKKNTKERDINFQKFWNSYPNKTGKQAAIASWKNQKPVLDNVLKALEWQKKSDQWQADNGKFIPNPSTYLNQGRWQDEPSEQISTIANHREADWRESKAGIEKMGIKHDLTRLPNEDLKEFRTRIIGELDENRTH